MINSSQIDDQPLLGGGNDDQPSWVTLANDANENGKDPVERTVSSSSDWSSEFRMRPPTSSDVGDDGDAMGWGRGGGQSDGETPQNVILLTRISNMGTAGLLIFGSISNIINIFNISKMVLSFYGILFSSLILALETDLSFLRHPIASNFGFVYHPFLRFLFYILMGMVSWSMESILGYVASALLLVLAFWNTYVLCRYPGYRKALEEVADEEERRVKGRVQREVRDRAWHHVVGGG